MRTTDELVSILSKMRKELENMVDKHLHGNWQLRTEVIVSIANIAEKEYLYKNKQEGEQ